MTQLCGKETGALDLIIFSGSIAMAHGSMIIAVGELIEERKSLWRKENVLRDKEIKLIVLMP